MLAEIVERLRQTFGAGWGKDRDLDLEFAEQMAAAIGDIDGIHLAGLPERDGDRLLFRCWLDEPLPDLIGADQLALAALAIVCGELLFTERRFAGSELVYDFATGAADAGHIGALAFIGPNAAEFIERFRQRTAGATTYQA
ncbi:MAG TPA: hypothetical protein VFQ80_16960 [Thermomicrobiales bacterium]|nr:hypothetical protein [Thermomicrobiales bacterium]